jgi:molybdenum cofactor synthesis domain-containing protein
MAVTLDTPITAGLAVIGDEILSGRTKDRNIGTIADHLTAIGIALKEVRVVPDEEDLIVEAVNALRHRYTYVFTTGGIGPTHDDITADAIAKAFGVSIDVDPRAVAIMKPAYAKRGIELNAARLRMARMPAGAELVVNEVSVAPGFRMGNVIVMAGVPSIMESMLSAATAKLETGNRVLSASIVVAHAEGEIAELFASHQAAWPQVSMGSYPAFKDGQYATDLVLRATDAEALACACNTLTAKLAAGGFSFVAK